MVCLRSNPALAEASCDNSDSRSAQLRAVQLADPSRCSSATVSPAWHQSRDIRVLCMLVSIWVLAGFDYGFTVLACTNGLAAELNPLALRILHLGPVALLAYKISLVVAGSVSLVRYRHRLLTEVLTAAVFVAYAVVMIRWKIIYDLYGLIATLTPPGYRVRDGLI